MKMLRLRLHEVPGFDGESQTWFHPVRFDQVQETGYTRNEQEKQDETSPNEYVVINLKKRRKKI